MAFNLRPSESLTELTPVPVAVLALAGQLSAGEYSLAWALVASVAALILVSTFVYTSAHLQE